MKTTIFILGVLCSVSIAQLHIQNDGLAQESDDNSNCFY